MISFEEQLLRFKQATGVLEDQEAAALLGITKAALSERKKRGSFPTKAVFALAAQRPELGLDPDWVVTGVSLYSDAHDKAEETLLQHYRLMTPATCEIFLKVAAAMSGAADMTGEEITRRLATKSK